MLHSLLHPAHLLSDFGYLGLLIIVLIDCGLPIGFIFPGDSLLISAGIVASQGHMNIFIVMGVTALAAIVGYSVGYYFGAKLVEFLERSHSRLVARHEMKEAHNFFEKYGIQSVILARFVPFARTFAPIIAGTSSMSHKKFTIYNVIGGVAWAIVMPMLGFTLGRTIPHIDRYMFPAVVVILVSSIIIPAAWHFLRKRSAKS